MDSKTKQDLIDHAEALMEENPPRYGEHYYEPGDPRLLRLRMAYQRWLLLKLAARFPKVPMVDVVTEVVGPLVH